ncbi:MAG: hypothetical protein K2Q20_00155 [Phycisphaerales bacterium]|nr:hypothetical protein [Phycisphaerales bacterium]
MPLIPTYIHDDRGRRVRLVAHRLGSLFPLRPLPLAEANDTGRTAQQRSQRILAQARRQDWRDWTNVITWPQVLAIIAGAGFLSVGIFLASSWLPLPTLPNAHILTPLTFVAGSIIGNVILYRPVRGRVPQIRAALLAERLCPSCAYDLAKSPRDPNGLTMCPECGAAWNV